MRQVYVLRYLPFAGVAHHIRGVRAFQLCRRPNRAHTVTSSALSNARNKTVSQFEANQDKNPPCEGWESYSTMLQSTPNITVNIE